MCVQEELEELMLALPDDDEETKELGRTGGDGISSETRAAAAKKWRDLKRYSTWSLSVFWKRDL